MPSYPPVIQRPELFDQLSDCPLHDVCEQYGIEAPLVYTEIYPTLPEFCDPALLAFLPRIRDLIAYGNIFGLLFPYRNKKLGPVASAYQCKIVVVRHQVASYKAKSLVDAVFQNAIIAFLMINFLLVNPQTLPLRWITATLDAGLSPEVTSYLQETVPEVLLWISMVGSFCSIEQSEHPRYLRLVQRIATHLNLDNWDDCHRCLKNFAFLSKSRLTPHFERVFASAVGSTLEEPPVSGATTTNKGSSVSLGIRERKDRRHFKSTAFNSINFFNIS